MSEDPISPSGQNDPQGEIVLLRKILKEVIRQEGRRIVNAGDYHRNTVSFANKIGVPADDVKRILEPILREVFEEMFAKKESNRTQQRRR